MMFNQVIKSPRLFRLPKSYLLQRQWISKEALKPSTTIIQSRTNKFCVGSQYEGFVCTQAEYIPDFNMTAYMFKHEANDTEYLHIDRKDTNNVFSVNFRTTPFDSTGIPHILEHNVLCGSEKFPVRDPFFKMLNRSVATFMNAMTGPDYTLYPFSSINEVDYKNLQTIYLDAVFRPNLRYLDFLQEGWRLEHKNLDNKESEYILKGVVYNEMKGSFSENSNVFGQKFFNQILPNHTYGYVSGGDPLDIPNLTHTDLVEFHHKYYHPSNARIFSYGCNQLEPTLKYINETYMKDYCKIDTTYSVIPSQKRWTEPKTTKVISRFDNMGSPIEKQNQIAIGYLMTDITDIYETFLLNVLTELLVKGPNSYFYKSLIEPNISGGYNQLTGFDSSIKDTLFVVGLQDITVDDFETVQRVFDETINKIVEKGFEQSHIDSVLHNYELQLKHQTPKFGLGLLFNLTPIWNHNGDLIKAMNVSSLIQELRANLKNPRYLQDKVDYYFRKNNHRLTMTMTPDLEYEQNFNKMEVNLLERKVKELTKEDRDNIYRDGLNLADSQKREENTDILPCLKLEDIPIEIEKVNITNVNINNIPTQLCLTNTNSVIYFKGIFDGIKLTMEQKQLLPLFTSMISQFGTKNYNYQEFDQLINSNTSGLSFGIHFNENINDHLKYEIGVSFGTYCLNNNATNMFDIWNELFLNYNLKDIKRFEMLLENYLSALAVGISDSGHMYAIQCSSGLISDAGKLKESLSGIEHIEYMKNLTKKFTSSEIMGKLNEIAEILFEQNSMRCALNISETDKDDILKKYEFFVKYVPSKDKQTCHNIKWNNSTILESSNLHHVMNIPVNFCGKSFLTVPYVNNDYASLKIIAKILSSKYLLPTIREQNGAYGAGAKISSDGIFNFFSYRDPNSLKTMEVFDNAGKWFDENIKNFNDQVLFEAKLGVLQQLDTPKGPGEKGMEQFKHGITQEIFAEHRQKILAVQKNDLELVNQKYLINPNEKVVGKCILGPENSELISENWKINKPE